jgi:hypothetical protein
MLTFSCPTCGTRHSAPDAHRGQQITCQVCKAPIRVPGEAREVLVVAPMEEREEAPRERRPSRPPAARRSRWEDEDDDGDDRDRRPGRRRRGPCPECGSTARPREVTHLTPASVVFFVLGMLFLPVVLLGLYNLECWEECQDCRSKLRRLPGPLG